MSSLVAPPYQGQWLDLEAGSEVLMGCLLSRPCKTVSHIDVRITEITTVATSIAKYSLEKETNQLLPSICALK